MNTFQNFVEQHFQNQNGIPLFLPLKQSGDMMIGTKNNLSLNELQQVHTNGVVALTGNKVYRMIDKKDTSHLELRLKYTDNIICIDVDGYANNGDISLDEFWEIEGLPDFFKELPYTLSRKKKLPHFYAKLCGIDIQTLKNTYTDCFTLLKGDILFNHCWEKKDAEIFNYKYNVPYIDINDIQPILKNKLFEKRKEQINKTQNNVNNDFEKFLDIINEQYLSNFSDWTKIIWAGKACNVSEDFLRNISKKASNYSDEGFDNVYMSYDNPTSTIGTIKYYARLSNEKEYFNILSSSFKLTEQTDLDVAKLYINLYGDNYIYKDGLLYTYYNNKWRVDDKPYRFLKASLQTHLIAFLNKIKDNLLSFKIEGEQDMEKFKTITKDLDKYFKKVSTSSDVNSICETFINHLSSKHADLENVFDEKPYIFCFNNISYDLLTGKEYEVLKGDYITQNTHYDYIEPTKVQIDLIDKLYKQIFPDPEIRKCWLSIQFMGMTGIREEKFILANGCGRNGKGLLNELFQAVLGNDYFYKLPVDVLQSKMDLSKGANPQVANMDNKRFILSSEPEENDKLRMNMIKDLTGGAEINARKLFQNECKVRMKQVQVLECNEKPKLSGTMNPAVLERIIDVPFVSKFISDPQDVDEENNIYLINKHYKTYEFQQEHKCALFKYIMDNAMRELYIPPCIKNRSANYVMDSDELYQWFSENYELTNEKDDILKMKDIYSLFKDSEFFAEKTKEEKRKLNYKGFIGAVNKSIAFQGKYFNDTKYINGFTYGERIIKYKLKENKSDEI